MTSSSKSTKKTPNVPESVDKESKTPPTNYQLCKPYGGFHKFMLSYGLKPWNLDDVDLAKAILEEFRNDIEQGDGDSVGSGSTGSDEDSTGASTHSTSSDGCSSDGSQRSLNENSGSSGENASQPHDSDSEDERNLRARPSYEDYVMHFADRSFELPPSYEVTNLDMQRWGFPGYGSSDDDEAGAYDADETGSSEGDDGDVQDDDNDSDDGYQSANGGDDSCGNDGNTSS